MDGNSQEFPLEIWLGAKFWPRISGPRFLTQISGSFTGACTTKQVKGLGRKLVRAEVMRISSGNFVPRWKFRPWGGISSPENKFLAESLDTNKRILANTYDPPFEHSRHSSILCNTRRIPAAPSTRLKHLVLLSNTKNRYLEHVLSTSPFWCLMTTEGFATSVYEEFSLYKKESSP
jgi:hypothetical protein